MPKGFGFVDPKKAKDDPLVPQHVKFHESTIAIARVRAAKEQRHILWVYRDWINKAAAAYEAELKSEQVAKKKQAKKATVS